MLPDLPNEAVPYARSNAAPDCWECAGCGLIISLDDRSCPRCRAVDQQQHNGGGDLEATQQRLGEVVDG